MRRAPEPNEIMWEHLHWERGARKTRRYLSYSLILLLIVLGLIALYAVRIRQITFHQHTSILSVHTNGLLALRTEEIPLSPAVLRGEPAAPRTARPCHLQPHLE